MATYTVKSFAELKKLMAQHMRARELRIAAAVRASAVAAVEIAGRRAAVAFEELKNSGHVEGTKAVFDAPHAAASENGSRAHWAPIAPLIRWCELRVSQGKMNGDPKRIAYAVQKKIAEVGTAPTWFAALSVPEVVAFLDTQIKLAMPDR